MTPGEQNRAFEIVNTTPRLTPYRWRLSLRALGGAFLLLLAGLSLVWLFEIGRLP